MLLGFLIRSALLAAAVSTIAIVISGIITREKIQQELRNRGVNGVIIDKIDNCTNTMTLKELENDNKIEVQGDGIDYSLYEGEEIRIQEY